MTEKTHAKTGLHVKDAHLWQLMNQKYGKKIYCKSEISIHWHLAHKSLLPHAIFIVCQNKKKSHRFLHLRSEYLSSRMSQEKT